MERWRAERIDRRFVWCERTICGSGRQRRKPLGWQFGCGSIAIARRKVHHDGEVQLFFKLSSGDGGDGVLRQDEVEFDAAGGFDNHALQVMGIEDIFDVSQTSVAAHFPFGELMKMDTKALFNLLGFGDLGAKDMDFMAAMDEFFNQIYGFGGTAAGGRIKRFMRQKRDAQPGIGLLHVENYYFLTSAYNLFLPQMSTNGTQIFNRRKRRQRSTTGLLVKVS